MAVNRRMFKFNLGVFLIGLAFISVAGFICAVTSPNLELAHLKSISIFMGLFALMGYTYHLDKSL